MTRTHPFLSCSPETWSVTRRTWLRQHVRMLALLPLSQWSTSAKRSSPPGKAHHQERWSSQPLFSSARLPSWKDLVHQAVEAAVTAGASYADARLTRTVSHKYHMTDNGKLEWEEEYLGLGVRALVHGYWGFAAQPDLRLESVSTLARQAVAMAQENAKGPARTVELAPAAAVTGDWKTPLQIDPFQISIEEKLDAIRYWKDCATQNGYEFFQDGGPSWLRFQRQERVLAASTGTLVTQTVYETEGVIQIGYGRRYVALDGLDAQGAGWEMIIAARIPEQIPERVAAAEARDAIRMRPVTPGRYTLVLDGATMAALVDRTIGVGTQLDRALGYEANASGTSFLDDPLAMVGSYALTAPEVTVMANRSAPTQLATVQWDDEGVVPEDFPLIKNGIVHDYQTTREQASWLAPYYQQQGRPVRSHGCASAQDALFPTLQMMPNLALVPNASPVTMMDLVNEVPDGILVEAGDVIKLDFQARTGILGGQLRQIRNGQAQERLEDGRILFTTAKLWKQLHAIGGVATQMRISRPQDMININQSSPLMKGEPQQAVSYSVSAVAALIADQPLIVV